MLSVVVASQNPIKVDSVKRAFSKVFQGTKVDVIPKSFPSGVSDQPMTDNETLTGAKNRAENAKNEHPKADYWIGIEGGVETKSSEMHVFAWVYILSENQMGKAKTATFLLPKAVVDLVNQGKELGEADDIVFNKSNSKQKSGAVGILTHDLIDRATYYEPAVVLALIPFVNQALYQNQ